MAWLSRALHEKSSLAPKLCISACFYCRNDGRLRTLWVRKALFLRDLLLLNPRDHPAALAADRLGEVPDLVERHRGLVGRFADEAGEAHADDVLVALVDRLQHLGVDRYHVGGLRGVAALGELHADFGEHLGRGEGT